MILHASSRTVLYPLAALALLLGLGSCSEESAEASAVPTASARAIETVPPPFVLAEWPRPDRMMLERELHGASRHDTLELRRDPLPDGLVRLVTRFRDERILGTQVLSGDGGILSQEGFEDSSAFRFRFSRPFREVPVRISLDAPIEELVDTVPFEVESRTGRLRRSVAIVRIRAASVACPPLVAGRCVEFTQRTAFALDGKVSGYAVVQTWNSTVGLLGYRTPSETTRRILP